MARTSFTIAAASGQVDEKGVFTHVFERAHSGWLCINSQRTVLREDGGKGKKQSNAELPFHIPIFGKSDKKDVTVNAVADSSAVVLLECLLQACREAARRRCVRRFRSWSWRRPSR